MTLILSKGVVMKRVTLVSIALATTLLAANWNIGIGGGVERNSLSKSAQ